MDQSVSDNRQSPIKDEIAEAYIYAASAVNQFLYKSDLRTLRICQQNIGYLGMVADKPIQKYYKDDQTELDKIDGLVGRVKKLVEQPENDLGWAKSECNEIIKAYYSYLVDANIIRV